MEYPSAGKVNRGRLCPRGNSASIVLDHPRRLCYPLLDGKETAWNLALDTLRTWISSVRSEEIAVVQSRGLTETETKSLRNFALALGTRNVVRGYLEPDNCFRYQLEGTRFATLEDVRSARSILLIGDVFSTSPVLSGPILDARYGDRKNRMVVIDSLQTRESGFAHQFIRVKPGTEAFALLALAGLMSKTSGLDVDKYAELSGTTRRELEAAVSVLRVHDKGIVGCAMHLGRVRYPVLLSLAAQLVATGLKMPFLGFAETRVPDGWMTFADFRKACQEGRLKLVLWFGALYPYSYPELLPELGNVMYRAATSIFRPEQSLPGLVLPVVSELEKETRGISYWGEVERHPLASAPSGTKMPEWIMGEIGKAGRGRGEGTEPAVASERTAQFSPARLVELGSKYASLMAAAESELLLVGEKRAFGIGTFYTSEDELVVNPTDAGRLKLHEGCWVRVHTVSAAAEFRVRLSAFVPPGALVVGVNAHRNRALFPLETDQVSGETEIPPVAATVEKIDSISLLPMEVVRAG